MTELSAVILAGGRSSRMKTDKAELELSGKRFIDILTYKLLSMGISDIMISGYERPVAHTRYIPDIYPGKGPLSGIHAGLKAAAGTRVLFIAVDAPLIPVSFLEKIAAAHTNGITAAECGGILQPMTAVYDKQLCAECDAFIKADKLKVRELMQKTGYKTITFEGNELLIRGCNTPEEYSQLKEYALTSEDVGGI